MSSDTTTPLGRLAHLEYKYRIVRAPLKAALQQALAEQRDIDAFMTEHGRPATEWATLARQYRTRRDQLLRAGERLGREAVGSRLKPEAVVHLVARLHFLLRELAWGLNAQVKAAMWLRRVWRQRSGRGPGRPSAWAIDACLKRLVSDLEKHDRSIPRRDRLDYVAALAQQSGVLRPSLRNPGEALEARLRRHREGPDLAALEAASAAVTAAAVDPEKLWVLFRELTADENWPPITQFSDPTEWRTYEADVRSQLESPDQKLEIFPARFHEDAKLSVLKGFEQSQRKRRNPRTVRK